MRTFFMLFGLAAAAATTWAADVKAGQAAYDKSCKSCHGADGTPNAAIAKMMKVEMRDLKSPDVQATSDDDLKKAITDGKGKMKPIASASASAADIVAYLRTWKK
jgi:mono/diheme cytochrome c family protein